MRKRLPEDIHVIVRDWLNANQILLFGDNENVLIDSGHVSCADNTVVLLRERLGSRKLHRIINTHCHSDHCGGNAAVKRAFGCTITVPDGDEAHYVERWDTQALWLDYSGQMSERFRFDSIVGVNDVFCVGNHEWLALAAPGHAMGALMFWCERARILISGDALWENGFGIVLPGPGMQTRMQAARDTLLQIRSLRPDIVIPGHGAPFTDVDTAITKSISRVNTASADEEKLAKHVLKVMFTFSLMEREAMDERSVVAFMERTPMYGEYDRRYFSMGSDKLAAWLIADLLKSGAIERNAHMLRPAPKSSTK